MKTCTLCKQELLEQDFNKNKTKKDGLSNVCRLCSNQVNKERYQTHKISHKEKVKKRKYYYKKKIHEYVLTYLKLHPCVDCGEKDPVVLEFDHVRDKIQNISTMIKRQNPINQIIAEIEKCEIRCANCHRRKTAKDFFWYKLS